MTSLSGYFLATPTGVSLTPDLIELHKPLRPAGPTFLLSGKAFGSRHWISCQLDSPVPLADEFPDSNRDLRFAYKIFLAISGPKLILLAPRRNIADYVVSNILNKRIFPPLRKVYINLDSLIEHCTLPESEFLITSLQGRYSGSSRNLRTISMYGDNVTDSVLYRDHGRLFNFTNCGIGRRLYDGLPKLSNNDDGEILRISNDGSVTANLSGRAKPLEFLRVMNFIVSNGWVDGWLAEFKVAPR